MLETLIGPQGVTCATPDLDGHAAKSILRAPETYVRTMVVYLPILGVDQEFVDSNIMASGIKEPNAIGGVRMNVIHALLSLGFDQNADPVDKKAITAYRHKAWNRKHLPAKGTNTVTTVIDDGIIAGYSQGAIRSRHPDMVVASATFHHTIQDIKRFYQAANLGPEQQLEDFSLGFPEYRKHRQALKQQKLESEQQTSGSIDSSHNNQAA